MSNFIFTYVNINSFRHKFAPSSEILSKKLVDFMAIAETKLDSSFPSAQFYVEDFTLHRQDFTALSGGLIVYIRSDLPHRRLKYAEVNCDGFESLCIEVTIGNTKTAITALYKHPAVNNDCFKKSVSHIADCLLKTYDDLVFLGDANCCPTKSTTIQDLCDTYGLSNLVKEPTCHKGPTSTLLDVILVTNHKRYSGVLNTNFCLSDVHNIIGAATKRFAPSQKPRKINYRSFHHFNDSDFLYDISSAPFHVAEIFDDVDDTSTLITDVVDFHAPMKSKFVKCKPVAYMNSQLRKALYARNMARNKFKKFGKSHWEENRRERNRVVSIRKQSIKNYFSKKCEKADRNFWATIKPFLTDKKFKGNNTIILNENDKTVTDSCEVAEIFNKYFVSIASEIGPPDPIISADEAISTHQNHPSVIKIREKHSELYNSFSFHAVNPEEIMVYMKQFNIKKATGYDNIPGKIIRLAQKELSVPFANLINTSLSRNIFPDVMKCAEVSPIFKKDDNLLKGNFRLVSILTSISKIYENVLNHQLLGHFYAIFNDLLSAFRKGHSCQSLLLKFVEDMKNALDQKHAVGALFMDLSKAFDGLPHGLLVAKLHAYGLSPAACCLLGDYLSGRTGSGWKYPTPEVPGKLLPKVSPRVLSWVPCFLTFSSTTCFILWKNVRCIIMQTTILCQT